MLGLRPTGVETLPKALIDAGLAEQLRARRAGRVAPPPYDDRRDPETSMLNPHGIAAYTPRLADAVGEVLEAGEFPVVLGGDCSIILGGLLALRRRGRYGLLFVDGHADFYQPEANINGEAASSDLALATGRGPDIMTAFEILLPAGAGRGRGGGRLSRRGRGGIVRQPASAALDRVIRLGRD